MKKLTFVLFLFLGFSLHAQEQKDAVTNHFDQYLTHKSIFEMIEKSFPTLEECQQVFIGDNAKVYFNSIQEIKKVIQKILSQPDSETLVKSSYEKFSSNDAKSEDGKGSFGMNRIKEVLQPDIIYYMVSYQTNRDSDSKYSPFKFFVKLNGKWLFFPKPTLVFDK